MLIIYVFKWSFYVFICYICIFFSETIFCPFSSWIDFGYRFFVLFCFAFTVEFWQFIIYLRYELFVRYEVCKYFLPVYRWPFHLLNGVFWRVKVFHFNKIKLPIFASKIITLVSNLRILPSRFKIFYPMIFSKSFIIFHFMFQSVNIFSSKVCGLVRTSNFSLWISNYSSTIWWRSYLSSTDLFLVCQKKIT